MPIDRLERARVSLQGLALGDALGSQFFVPANRHLPAARELPPAPWSWTDDTEMACVIVTELAAGDGLIDQDRLIAGFAGRYDFDRGYGPSTNRFLRRVRDGEDWRLLLGELFDGQGSWGNGAAMRVAPLGAYHAGDPEQAARQAALSATVTHTHPEAVAGAIAVAVAACLVAAGETSPGPLLDTVLRHVPPGRVRDGIRRARGLLPLRDPEAAARELGNGRDVSAHGTVPFTLWAAATRLRDFPEAVWAAVRAGGDVDTTCAIVAGVVAARLGFHDLPLTWIRAAEPLPPWAGQGPTVGSHERRD
ncbi:ADP-ribosylglycohydrolase family protein [Actinomadura craniellae]|uniref:ADP-ribosylglycohydrolase family protein n=1 Tax=Actinomadura craniellae TaxID=2231787 RepID=A0A365GVH7_9ACTN|nr:ADP-ribosylglycohydrolase family protein [Actinomadura craniellae]RAY10782.1 ADP-ribosylglycohydrolase family protein [Actinomadura craniellae]